MADQPKRGVLMALAAEGMVPVLGGCAGALAGGPEAGVVGGMVGVAVGQAVEKVINFFGGRIVYHWGEWFRSQPEEVRQQALHELATMPPEQARKEAEAILDRVAPAPIAPADKELALAYLSLLPGALDRALPRDLRTGLRSLPASVSVEEPSQLLALLPVSLPPYAIGSDVPGTPYHLDGLLGSGGFGAVYRASTRSLQHLPLAIKFCLDPTLVQALHRERANLERLMKAGGQDWSPRVVRLYGYDLEHKTPYLVYEFVTGGDLIRHLSEKSEQLGRALDAKEVLELITQLTEALTFAHEHGLVHRDLKPANVLVESGVLKLADFGLGGVSAARAAQVSRIGATTVDLLSLADQASLFRGAGTPLYMAPEQRRGQAPDPRHDLYSLGVMWYQMLVGDVSRELHPGWAKELTLRFGVPKAHIDLIDACVGWFDERPKNAGELLKLIRGLNSETAPAFATPALPPPLPAPATMRPVVTPPETVRPTDEMRQSLLKSQVRQLHDAHAGAARAESQWVVLAPTLATAFFVVIGATESRMNFFLGFFLTALIAGGVGWVCLFVRRWRRDTARETLTGAVQTLAREFPEVVESWGGVIVLQDPEVVAQLAQKLGVVEVPPPPAVPVKKLDSAQRKKLVGQIEALAEKVEHAEGFASRKPFPLVLALLVGLAVGGGAGVGSTFAYLGFNWPELRTLAFGQTEYYSRLGETIDRAEYLRLYRQATATGVAVGVSVGLAVALLVGLTLSRRSWYRLQLVLGSLIGLILGAGIGAGVAALYYSLSGPYYDHTGFNVVTYYAAGGGELTWINYVLTNRKVITTAILLGAGIGLVLLLFTVNTWQRMYQRRCLVARQLADEEALKLATDFPEAVSAAGGMEGLSRSESLAEVRQKFESF